MIENTIGIIIGIMDGQDGQARISLAGPQHKVAAAQQLIQIAAGGGGHGPSSIELKIEDPFLSRAREWVNSEG